MTGAARSSSAPPAAHAGAPLRPEPSPGAVEELLGDLPPGRLVPQGVPEVVDVHQRCTNEEPHLAAERPGGADPREPLLGARATLGGHPPQPVVRVVPVTLELTEYSIDHDLSAEPVDHGADLAGER